MDQYQTLKARPSHLDLAGPVPTSKLEQDVKDFYHGTLEGRFENNIEVTQFLSAVINYHHSQMINARDRIMSDLKRVENELDRFDSLIQKPSGAEKDYRRE